MNKTDFSPCLPLRDIVVFPGMIVPLFVGRDKSIKALNEVMKTNKKTGARGLRSIIEALLLKTMFKLPTMDDVEEVVINEAVVKNNSEPLIIHSRSKKISAA